MKKNTQVGCSTGKVLKLQEHVYEPARPEPSGYSSNPGSSYKAVLLQSPLNDSGWLSLVRVSLSLLYGYSTLCAQRSKCIDGYKISTSQRGGSCPEHSAARKGEGKRLEGPQSPLQTVKNVKQSELSCWKKGLLAKAKHFGTFRHISQHKTKSS